MDYSRQFVYIAVRTAANSPARLYNPLFVSKMDDSLMAKKKDKSMKIFESGINF